MEAIKIQKIVERQQSFFKTGKTRDTSFRRKALMRLKKEIERQQEEILKALYEDLGKSRTEGFMSELTLVLGEINYMLRHLDSLSRDQLVLPELAQLPSVCIRRPVPYGTVLIMSPWNYPFMLTIEPLVDALAAGNTAVVKPSAYAPHTALAIEKVLKAAFPEKYVAIVQGGREKNEELLNQKFDYIFFTGSMNVGKIVMEKAAKHLTPVSLELGGKSPCFVDRTADISLAARRIVFGKFLNCGQTCVAPDYILCHESIKEHLVSELIREVQLQYGRYPLANKNYGKIVNKKHFQRLTALIDKEKCVWGGDYNEEELRIEPTILADVTYDDPVMQEEIFGPVLPIVTYRSLWEAVEKVESLPHPLALYIFSQSPSAVNYIQGHCRFGGGCVNDTIIHLATSQMGFGGVGESGMGSYHGKDGFAAFTHYTSIVKKGKWPDLSVRYQPYTKAKDEFIHRFLS